MTQVSLSFQDSGLSTVCCTQTPLGAPASGDSNTPTRDKEEGIKGGREREMSQRKSLHFSTELWRKAKTNRWKFISLWPTRFLLVDWLFRKKLCCNSLNPDLWPLAELIILFILYPASFFHALQLGLNYMGLLQCYSEMKRLEFTHSF